MEMDFQTVGKLQMDWIHFGQEMQMLTGMETD